ncbi:ATP-grasp domain-containing protein [Streptomyces sp. NPDC001811]
MNPQPPHVIHIGFEARHERLLRAGQRLSVLLDEDAAAALPDRVRERFARIGALRVPREADLDNYDSAFGQMVEMTGEFSGELGAPAAVVGLTEESVLPAARLREHLGLPGMRSTTARLLRDKVRMKEAVREAGVTTPRFWPVGPDTGMDEVERIAGRLRGAVVLKPRTQAAAMGVHVFPDPAAFVAHVRTHGLRPGHQVEEFVEGRLCHVDGLVREGRLLFLSMASYLAAPYEVVTREGRPLGSVTVDDPDLLSEAERMSRTVLRAVGLDDGVFHLEVFAAPSGELTFLEVAGRVGGSGIGEHIRQVYGIDLAEEALRVCLGERHRYTGPRTILESGVGASGWLHVLVPATGRSRKVVRLDGVAELPGSVVRHTVPRVGDIVPAAPELYQSAGEFTLTGPASAAVADDIARLFDTYAVRYAQL